MNTRPMDPGPPRPGPPPDQGGAGQVDPSQRMLTEIAQLRVKASGRDLVLLRLGAALLVVGPLLTIAGYLQSSQAANAMFQNDAIIIALVGVTTAMVGATLFLRYSLGEFLRFWMARILAEQHRPPVMRRPEPGPGQGPGPGPGPGPGQGHAPPPPNGRMGAPAPGPQQRPSAPAPPPARPPWADRRPEQQP
jgi:hypothetical protein